VKKLETPQLIDLIQAEPRVERQAALWSDALRDGDAAPELRRAFDYWRDAQPEHAQAFEAIDRTYRLFRAAGNSHAPFAVEAEILARLASRRRVRQRAFAGLAAGVLVMIAAGYALTGGSWHELMYLKDRARYALQGDALYRTAVGERLVVALDDGSVLTLNTDSRAVVRYREAVRGILLEQGQALFEVAKDPSHPFVVTAGGRKVTALGTAFDVRVSPQRLQVTLLEGRVAVEPAQVEATPASRTELSPGEQFVLAAGAEAVHAPAPQVRRTDTRRATSWRDGQIIFSDDPLRDAVAEINRYARRRVVLADEELGTLRVSGAFNTNNTQVFVNMLMLHFPIRVAETGDDRIVLAPR
jgi:transmembrane sensor